MTTPKKPKGMQGSDELPATLDDNFAKGGWGGSMNDKNRDALQIVATILGNISAISAGIAIFEKGQFWLGCISGANICSNGCNNYQECKMNYLLVIGFGLALFAYGQYVARRKHD